jgi:fatty acid desaturase
VDGTLVHEAEAVSTAVLWEPGAWRTCLVALAIYSAYAALTLAHAVLPTPILVVLGGLVIAWHGSLQHETIHGHPSTSARCNDALGMPPLALWLPYRLYRASHLQHHRSALCDPRSDPESNYVDAPTWARSTTVARWLWWSQRTMIGRLLLGPWILAGRQLRSALHAVLGGGPDRRIWLEHAVAVGLVLLWVRGIAQMPIATYLMCFVYPGLALTSMRSLAEHRPALRRSERSAIVEAHPLWSILFLHNNLHAVHHRWPRLPWYRLPGQYRRQRANVLQANGAWRVAGYGTLWRRHAWRPIDPPSPGRAADLESP